MTGSDGPRSWTIRFTARDGRESFYLRDNAAGLLRRRIAAMLRSVVGSDRSHCMNIWSTARLLLALLCAHAGLCRADWYQDTQAIMGTKVHVELSADDATKARASIAVVMAEMMRIDVMMSPYKPDSDLSRLNRDGFKQAVVIPPEMFDVIAQSIKGSQFSGGAFDVTYASVGRYYNYREHIKPDAATIKSALPAISYRHLVLDPQRYSVRYTHPGVYVDLGGIAKGWAVDHCIEMLRRAGYTQALVSAGGDSRFIGDHGGKPWIIGIKDPRGNGEPIAVLPLQDIAMSTSGDYERFFEANGVRYHHIIDPKTGDSARKVRSVTVLGKTATWTEVLTKTVFILGADQGLAVINKLGDVDAIVVDNDGKLRYSDTLMDATPERRGAPANDASARQQQQHNAKHE